MTPEQQENFDLRRKLYHANTIIEELQQGIAEITSNIEFHHAGALGRWMTTKEIDDWITKRSFEWDDAESWAEIWKKAAKKYRRLFIEEQESHGFDNDRLAEVLIRVCEERDGLKEKLMSHTYNENEEAYNAYIKWLKDTERRDSAKTRELFEAGYFCGVTAGMQYEFEVWQGFILLDDVVRAEWGKPIEDFSADDAATLLKSVINQRDKLKERLIKNDTTGFSAECMLEIHNLRKQLDKMKLDLEDCNEYRKQ